HWQFLQDEQNQDFLSNSTSATPSDASTNAWSAKYSLSLTMGQLFFSQDDATVIALSVAIPSVVVLLIIAIVVSVILLKKKKRVIIPKHFILLQPEVSIHSESVEYYNIDTIDGKNENIYMNEDTTQKNRIKHSPISSSKWIQSKASNNFDKRDFSASRESPKIRGSPYPLEEEDIYESTLPRDADSIYANQDIIETYRSGAKPKK
ncbi:hypothetical protein AOXY_G12974, partial [Acipenser oxyrinchus oxyrinchus]